MTIERNENNELVCKLQNIKNSDKYINFKKSIFRTSSIMRNKLNISYKNNLEDENINFLIKTFLEICIHIEQLIEALNKFETCSIEFIHNNKAIIESFKELFLTEEYEVFFNIACLKNLNEVNNLEEKKFLIQQHHDLTLAIRKSIVLAEQEKPKLYLEDDFNIGIYLAKGHDPAINEFQKIFAYFRSAVYKPLVDLNDNVFRKFKLAIKHREFLMMDYNRYKMKFDLMEAKELKSDLNILQEKNYKYFMRKLDDARLEYNIASETIRNDLNLFFSHMFPFFWKLWFEKYYYTVFSLSYGLYENIANSQEIHKFPSKLGDFENTFDAKKTDELNLKIREDYKTSMKLFQKITKKKSTLNYILG